MMTKQVANKIGHIAIDIHEHINGNSPSEVQYYCMETHFFSIICSRISAAHVHIYNLSRALPSLPQCKRNQKRSN